MQSIVSKPPALFFKLIYKKKRPQDLLLAVFSFNSGFVTASPTQPPVLLIFSSLEERTVTCINYDFVVCIDEQWNANFDSSIKSSRLQRLS